MSCLSASQNGIYVENLEFLLAYRAQLDSLMKLKWPALTCESVPWALHKPMCNLNGWSPVGPPPTQALSLPILDTEQVREPIDVDTIARHGTSKEELESAREDGELPYLVPAASGTSEVKLRFLKGSNLEHSRQLTLISKSLVPPISKAKSQSFKKPDEDIDLLLDTDSDQDGPAYLEPESETTGCTQYREMGEKSWVDYGVMEFCLVLTRSMDTNKRILKLEAKVTKHCCILELCPFIGFLVLHIKFCNDRSRSAWSIL